VISLKLQPQYRFFFPNVSANCVYKGSLQSGLVPNRVFGLVEVALGLRARLHRTRIRRMRASTLMCLTVRS